MSKPNYRVNLTFDGERKLFLARAPELEHCSAEGATRAEAIARLEEEIDAQLANMLSHGSTPPRSVDEEEFSGQIAAQVSKGLHRELAFTARSEGIELDHLVGELLASALEGRKQTHRGRSGNRAHTGDSFGNDNIGNRHDGGRRQGGFGRGTNPQLLDDRASFIEYVRGLEQGGNHAGHGGRGGHPGGPGGHDNRRRRRGRGGGNGNGNFRNDRPMQGQSGHGQPGPWNGNGAPRPSPPAGGYDGNAGAAPDTATGGSGPGNGGDSDGNG